MAGATLDQNKAGSAQIGVIPCCIAATILLSKDPRNGTSLRHGFASGRADRVVLNNSTEEMRECLRHAEECAREAAELPGGSPFRQDFLDLQNRWLELARSIEFGEQLDSFTRSITKRGVRA
jgi:hypothetical protein